MSRGTISNSVYSSYLFPTHSLIFLKRRKRQRKQVEIKKYSFISKMIHASPSPSKRKFLFRRGKVWFLLKILTFVIYSGRFLQEFGLFYDVSPFWYIYRNNPVKVCSGLRIPYNKRKWKEIFYPSLTCPDSLVLCNN